MVQKPPPVANGPSTIEVLPAPPALATRAKGRAANTVESLSGASLITPTPPSVHRRSPSEPIPETPVVSQESGPPRGQRIQPAPTRSMTASVETYNASLDTVSAGLDGIAKAINMAPKNAITKKLADTIQQLIECARQGVSSAQEVHSTEATEMEAMHNDIREIKAAIGDIHEIKAAIKDIREIKGAIGDIREIKAATNSIHEIKAAIGTGKKAWAAVVPAPRNVAL